MTDLIQTTEWKPRRGTQSDMNSFVGAAKELTATTDTKRLQLHDAATAGGAAVIPNVADLQQAKLFAAVAGGTANSLTLDLGAGLRPAGYAKFMPIRFEAASNNTGAATMNVTGPAGTGLGAKALKIAIGGALFDLSADYLQAGFIYDAIYDGTVLVMFGASGSGGGWTQITSFLTSSGTSAVPAQFRRPGVGMRILGGGGGAGPGDGSITAGTGGQSGGMIVLLVDLTGVPTLNITIGAGGATFTQGGNTIVSGYGTARGGSPGEGAGSFPNVPFDGPGTVFSGALLFSTQIGGKLGRGGASPLGGDSTDNAASGTANHGDGGSSKYDGAGVGGSGRVDLFA